MLEAGRFSSLLGMMQLLLGAFAFGDVTEDNDSADDFTVFITDQCGRYSTGKLAPIFSHFAPKHYMADPAWTAIPARRINGTTYIADRCACF